MILTLASAIAPPNDKVLTADAYCLRSELMQLEEEYNALPKETPEDEEQVQVWSNRHKETCKNSIEVGNPRVRLDVFTHYYSLTF